MCGRDLLVEFRRTRSEKSFSDLVRKYTNLVYSVARRRTSNDLLAQEVTQLVFIKLAKAPPKTDSDADLVGWLHRTTVNLSIDLWRSEARRRLREEQAVAMQAEPAHDSSWTELSPELDSSLDELPDTDRHALLLRFFDEKSMREVGAALGVSEEAAKMRVSRAVERLRTALSSKGVGCGSIALAGLLAERSVEAAPAAFAASLATLSFPVSGGLAASIVSPVLQISRAKLLVGAASVLVLATALLVGLKSRTSDGGSSSSSRPERSAVTPGSAVAPIPGATGELAATDGNSIPDPLALLQGVARARQRLESGSVELDLASAFFNRPDPTNYHKLSILFDGRRRRVEETVREYAYTLMGEAGEAQEKEMQQKNMSREAAVKAGLLKGFTTRYASAFDDNIFLQYRGHEGESPSATIEANTYNSSSYLPDPRCLGLRTSLFSSSTIENCLGYAEAKSIELVGKEFVNVTPAWHVRVLSKNDELLDFWIDVSHPQRVLKQAKGVDVVVSRYQGNDPIPVEVSAEEYRNGQLLSASRIVRSAAQFNLPVESSAFTLAGLGMKVGTPVTDIRIHRTIGYWNGTGLSECPPAKGTQPENTAAPNLAELMALLDDDPGSEDALSAAVWILLNTPDGPEVEKAAAVVLRYHLTNPTLGYLAEHLERVRHSSSRKLLEAILEKNPSREVRASACFSLAMLLNDESDYGKNKQAAQQAEKSFNRVISEFASSKPKGFEFAQKAKPLLDELRRLSTGKAAPQFEAIDLEGNPIALKDYLGKVVVLSFWSQGTDRLEEHRKWLEKLGDKPYGYITVNCDEDPAKAKGALEKAKINWPTICDGLSGPIAREWDIHMWTSVFVLDKKGVIRFRQVRGQDLVNAVEALLRE